MTNRVSFSAKGISKFSFLLCMLSVLVLFSQTSDNSGNPGYEPEKIYLQLSSTKFTSEQNIWFKAIVTNAKDHTPTKYSGVLYVDLVDSNGKIIAQRIVKLTKGIGYGSFEIFPSYHGQFLIRAYTQWNRNYGENQMFKQDLMVYKLTDQNKQSELHLSGPGELEGNIDVQFFPESGKMIHGITSKVAFKAVGFDGKARKVEGVILDNRGKKITSFESNFLGMGFIYLKPDSAKNYSAKLISKIKPSTSKNIIRLPKVMGRGSVLSVEKKAENIRFRIASSNQNDSIAVKVSCRGIDYFLIEGQLDSGSLISEIPTKSLPKGILVFTLMNKEGKPIAERLFYNESGDELKLTLFTDQGEYDRRARTRLDILVANTNKKTAFSNLSVKVISKNLWRKGMDRSIQSYFYLESELRGTIENPGHYFNKTNPNRNTDIEALLLTQGWRNYKYAGKFQGNNFFPPQAGLTLTGRVNKTSQKLKKENELDLTLTTFGKETTIYGARTDSLGNFRFLLNDAFGPPVRSLLGIDKKGIKNYTITLDAFPKPKVNFEHNPFLQEADTLTQIFLEGEKRRKKTEEVLDSLYGVTQLDEVVVEDYKLNPERRRLYEKYGLPDVVIRGDTLRQQEKKWSYGLYSILMANYGDEIQIERYPDGFMLAHIAGGPTLLMVDGRLIQRYEYDFVPQMPTGIIENIELIKFAKFFKSRYLTVFPETNPLEAPYLGHIIAINTKGKVGLQGTAKPTSGNYNTSIEVYSPIKEFYAPNYSTPSPEQEQMPDLRALIHWNPNLILEGTEKTTESFYNGDNAGDYIIIVEAISEDGAIGHETMTYSVRD